MSWPLRCDYCCRVIDSGETAYELYPNTYCDDCVLDHQFIVEPPEEGPDEDRIYDEWRDRKLMEEENGPDI